MIQNLFCRFPTDNKTWTIDRQFLWGSALMIVPILEQVSIMGAALGENLSSGFPTRSDTKQTVQPPLVPSLKYCQTRVK